MRNLLLALAFGVHFAASVLIAQPVPDAVQRATEAGTRSSSGEPGTRYWRLHPRYDAKVGLEPSVGAVRGTLRVWVENESPDELNQVVLRLDHNRFTVADAAPRTDGMRVHSIRRGEIELRSRAEFADSTRTVLLVPLPEAATPGDTIILDMEWSLEVPEDTTGMALRQGRWGKHTFQMGQWYPRIAMYDDVLGWDTAPHQGFAEFNNPFADFLVEIRVPSGWLVGATGELVNPGSVLSDAANEARVALAAASADRSIEIARAQPSAGPDPVWVFRADSVRDFAWGASANYVWIGTRSEGGATVNAYSTPNSVERMTEAAILAGEVLDALSHYLGRPRSLHHSLVEGPEGGMEYPGLTMSDGGGRVPHEIAHQWFPMTVGVDESRYSFIDEGLASFLPGLLLPYDPPAQPDRGVSGAMIEPDNLMSVRAVLGYGRGARMMQHLVERFGRIAVAEALRSFVASWYLKHPTPWDFMNSLERSLEADLDGFWREWLFSPSPIG